MSLPLLASFCHLMSKVTTRQHILTSPLLLDQADLIPFQLEWFVLYDNAHRWHMHCNIEVGFATSLFCLLLSIVLLILCQLLRQIICIFLLPGIIKSTVFSFMQQSKRLQVQGSTMAFSFQRPSSQAQITNDQ